MHRFSAFFAWLILFTICVVSLAMEPTDAGVPFLSFGVMVSVVAMIASAFGGDDA